ncbi:hypothetical protein [Streptomyces olivochromogenes]|uniref:hypothetical protein n=1 Tax=Streptomyces olivochromogenes TaxID=1963 RepID=UPI001F1BFF2A|nr:hypothetical protein [Streptomyces olivochromogenes]MCF3131955.1 hypothetical protein [Streptomyces olivochromogenes]
MNGKKKALLIAGGVLVVAAIANAGNSDTSEKAKPAAKMSPSPKAKPTHEAPAKLDEPNAAEEKQLLRKLTSINPGITVNRERAIRRSVSTCQEIQDGQKGKQLVKDVSYRFTGGNATVDERQAAEVIQAVKDTFCG